MSPRASCILGLSLRHLHETFFACEKSSLRVLFPTDWKAYADNCICFLCLPAITTFPPLLFQKGTFWAQWHFPSQWGHQAPEWYEITWWHGNDMVHDAMQWLEMPHFVLMGLFTLIWWIFCQTTSANAVKAATIRSGKSSCLVSHLRYSALLSRDGLKYMSPTCCPRRTFTNFAVAYVLWLAIRFYEIQKNILTLTICELS